MANRVRMGRPGAVGAGRDRFGLTGTSQTYDPRVTAIRPDRAFRDQAELDSFDFLRVLTRLHEQLGVDVPETDYGEFATLDRAVAYVIRRLGTSVGR